MFPGRQAAHQHGHAAMLGEIWLPGCDKLERCGLLHRRTPTPRLELFVINFGLLLSPKAAFCVVWVCTIAIFLTKKTNANNWKVETEFYYYLHSLNIH